MNLTVAQREMLDSALRVDQAGEVAANWIYKGQMYILGQNPTVGPLIQVCRTKNFQSSLNLFSRKCGSKKRNIWQY